MAAKSSLPKATAARAVDALFSAIVGALARGEPVRIRGFGTFFVKDRPARQARNPRTGEPIAVAASKASSFKAGKGLRNAVKGHEPVTTTNYRLKLKLRVGRLLDAKELSITALVGGRTVTIRSEVSEQPLSEARWLVLESRGFDTEESARAFGEELQRAAHLAGLCSRVGVDAGDPGDDRARSRINPEFLRSLPGMSPDLRVGPDVHGLAILPDDGNTICVRLRGNLSTRANSGDFVRTLEESIPESSGYGRGTPAIRRAIRVLSLAEMSEDPISKVVLSVSTVEGLATEPSWTEEQRKVIDEAAAWVQQTHGTEETTGQVLKAIRNVRSTSINQKVRKLLEANGLSNLWKDWKKLYGKRSRLFHGETDGEAEHRGKYLEDSELHGLGQDAVKLCGRIVLSIAKREGIRIPRRAGSHFGLA